MKKLILSIIVLLLIAGCSEQVTEEQSKSEELGKEIAGKMRAPIKEAEAVAGKVQQAREIPPME